MSIIYTKNEFHLGDNIFCCIFFCKIKKYIEENNIFIKHYVFETENIPQIKEFIYSKNIELLDIANMPTNDKVYDLWIGSNDYIYNIWKKEGNEDKYYDVFLCKFYNNILKELNIPVTINQFIFDDDDFLHISDEINNRTNNKYKNIDILFMNGVPRSGQINYYDDYDNIIIKFSKKYNIITTKKIENIKCTRDDNLSAKEIASISKNANKIIAIDSGISAGLFNTHVINNVEKVYYLCSHSHCICSFPNFIFKESINKLLFLVDEGEEKIENFENFEINNNFYVYFIFKFLLLLLLLLIVVLFYKKIKKNFILFRKKYINRNIKGK